MILKGRDSDEAICLVSKQVEEVGKQLQFSVFLLIRISFFFDERKELYFFERTIESLATGAYSCGLCAWENMHLFICGFYRSHFSRSVFFQNTPEIYIYIVYSTFSPVHKQVTNNHDRSWQLFPRQQA